MKTIEDLEKYSKERILNAINKGLWGRERKEVIADLVRYLEIEDYRIYREKTDELGEKCQEAFSKWTDTYKAYKNYMRKIAEKYNIINKNTNTYRFGDWVNNATKEEYNEALRLENIQREWFDKYKKYEKELAL